MRRVKSGDVVRLYGFPGTFLVQEYDGKHGDFFALPLGRIHGGWPALESSIVEINGEPVPLQSAPLVPPSKDYPWEPLFDYTDGPQTLGQSALRQWLQWQKA